MSSLVAADGIRIHYDSVGDGPSVVLLHGISANGEMNWEWTGIAPTVRAAGFHTVTIDQRGHGRSDKPHEPTAYDDDLFASDVSAVIDDLDIEDCALVGYSMGALMALRAVPHELRVNALVLGGIGMPSADRDLRESTASALETEEPDLLQPGEPRSIREYADATGADRRALAALQRGRSDAPYEFDAVTVPTLVIAGRDDDLADDAGELAGALPHATFVQVPGDHASALIEPEFREGVVSFLSSALR